MWPAQQTHSPVSVIRPRILVSPQGQVLLGSFFQVAVAVIGSLFMLFMLFMLFLLGGNQAHLHAGDQEGRGGLHEDLGVVLGELG